MAINGIVPFSFTFLFVCVFLLLSLELGRYSSDDLFLSSRPRTGLATTYISTAGVVEARSVDLLLVDYIVSVLF